MKKAKKAMAVVLVIVLGVLNFNDNVFGETYGEKTSTGQYVYVGYKQFGSLGYWTYKNNNNWVLFYPSINLTPIVYHEKYTGEDSLCFSYSVTQSRTKTSSWSVNGNVSRTLSMSLLSMFEKAISAAVGLGYGEAYARGYSYTSSGQVNKTIKDEAKTGYYTRVPGYTFYKMEVRVLKVSDYSLVDKFYFDEPYGATVVYTIYSKENKNWSIYNLNQR